MSNGKYLEVHDLDSIVTIGRVRWHVKNQQIVGRIIHDPTDPDAQPIGDAKGRWISIDPLREKIPNYGSYVFALNNPINFVNPTGMIAEPPTGVDASDGAIHTDSSGSWKYNKATTTWMGQNGAKDLGNTIALNNVNIKGYKSNYVPSGAYGPDKDPTHAAMVAGVVALPVLAVSGSLAAGGTYAVAEVASAFSQITLRSAITNVIGNAGAQYLSNGREFGNINVISTASSIIPGMGPAILGESLSFTANKGFNAPDSFNKWAVQAGAAVLTNRFGKATDNYLSGTGFSEAVTREYFKTLFATGANFTPYLVEENK
ncbi:hypothetical protein QWY99_08295 [Flavobacterium branchiarum]|uniref:RHS repeat-associated core domain-containing protein n=1 Tax=Flavobacterium branchiarum TaxID=1114870 RepID=A0ABV5FRJ5_9FLAO|nr:hypothetical protein [Flavobacterium branchiarum]MDN3673045.1 hypothetical protein [Flavobacterium branchiarum]